MDIKVKDNFIMALIFNIDSLLKNKVKFNI